MGIKSAIESILFIQGEPMSIARLVKATAASKKEVTEALEELAAEYNPSADPDGTVGADGRGIVLIQNHDEWQFVTNPANKRLVETFVTSGLSEELTKVGLEVLAIVAYKGPVSRAEIEYVRGVNSSFILRSLLIRGLIEREENPKDRRSYLYRVSHDFLKHLGLARLEDLAEYREFRSAEINPPLDLEKPTPTP